jgi:hypothetical protein
MELGGEARARLLPKLHMPVSADTVLRDIPSSGAINLASSARPRG